MSCRGRFTRVSYIEVIGEPAPSILLALHPGVWGPGYYSELRTDRVLRSKYVLPVHNTRVGNRPAEKSRSELAAVECVLGKSFGGSKRSLHNRESTGAGTAQAMQALFCTKRLRVKCKKPGKSGDLEPTRVRIVRCILVAKTYHPIRVMGS